MDARQFLHQAQVSRSVLQSWLEAGWLRPRRHGAGWSFSDVDLARAFLIRDLSDDLGLNEEAVPVVLDLVDQIHGLRWKLIELLSALRSQPADTRRAVAVEIRRIQRLDQFNHAGATSPRNSQSRWKSSDRYPWRRNQSRRGRPE